MLLSLWSLEKLCFSLSSQVFFFFFFLSNAFPILYYEYDCNTVCHKNVITTHSLLYRLAAIKQSYWLC